MAALPKRPLKLSSEPNPSRHPVTAPETPCGTLSVPGVRRASLAFALGPSIVTVTQKSSKRSRRGPIRSFLNKHARIVYISALIVLSIWGLSLALVLWMLLTR
jgi:hypothetical protein